MTQKIKIPQFTARHLRPRRQKRERVVLQQRVTVDGVKYLEAPAVCRVERPWQWSKE